MPVIATAAAVCALVLSQPGRDTLTTPPASTEERTTATEMSASGPTTTPTAAPIETANASSASLTPEPPLAPAPRKALRILSLAFGGWAGQTLEIGTYALGGRASIAHELLRPPLPFGLVELGLEFWGGRTTPGLDMRWQNIGFLAWSSPRRRVRVGGGFDLGLVQYRRATTREWMNGGTAGARAAVHADLLGGPRGPGGFVELHAVAWTPSEGLDFSVLAVAGVSFGQETRTVIVAPEPRGPREPADPSSPAPPPAAPYDPYTPGLR